MARSRSWRTGSSTPGPRLPSAACLRAVGRPERLVRCGRAYRTGLLDQTLAVLSSLMKGKKERRDKNRDHPRYANVASREQGSKLYPRCSNLP